jgi:lipid II:glycine glycyltransferase (peptidoglycan interpeptide bridge formation enzyme)
VEGDEIVGAAQVLTKRIPVLGGGLAWISRGPICRAIHRPSCVDLNPLLKALRDYWVDEKAFYLRIAPSAQIETEALTKFGFRRTYAGAWTSARLDLSRPISSLRAKLEGKWRAALSQAERSQSVVTSTTCATKLSQFVKSYKEIFEDRGYRTSVTPKLLADFCEFSRKAPEPRMTLYQATRNDRLLGNVLIATYGRTAEYLAAAVNEEGRSANTSRLLIWQAIRDASERHYNWFDIGGADPGKTSPGILRFKNGLNGMAYTTSNEIEAQRANPMSYFIRMYLRAINR